MSLSFNSTVGERIKYYRLAAGKTQKQLAEACNITEPAIRNYELGNRIPSFDTLSDIALELDVSFYALADPQISALGGAMHTLFRMEQAYGLSPIEIDGKVSLQINPGGERIPSYFEMALRTWANAHKMVNNGIWTLEDYQTWQSIFPYSTEGAVNHPLKKALGESTEATMPFSETPASPSKRKRKPKKYTSKKSTRTE